jgi:DNA-binding NtrC family response regulator
MGGEISVDSELGRGSRFTVTLPAYDAKEEAPVAKPVRPRRSPADPKRRARVLVVDDDRAVAKVVAAVLGDHHDVTVARSGREALAAIERDPDVDLIVCDLMMPEVSGIDLYEILVLVHPELAKRFLFMTGGAFTQTARTFLDRVAVPRIEKPFQSERLLAMVTDSLAELEREPEPREPTPPRRPDLRSPVRAPRH